MALCVGLCVKRVPPIISSLRVQKPDATLSDILTKKMAGKQLPWLVNMLIYSTDDESHNTLAFLTH